MSPLTFSAYLLRTIDDEIASRIKWTLIKLTKVSVCQAAQEAVCGAEHDGDFTNECFLMLCLNLVLPLLDDGLSDVDIQGRRIPEEAGLIRHVRGIRWGQHKGARTYVRFRSRASLGIMGDGAPSLSQWVGLDR